MADVEKLSGAGVTARQGGGNFWWRICHLWRGNPKRERKAGHLI